jgi:YYY domain-containing protein
MISLAIWTIGFLVLGWCAFPLMYVLFPSLPLRGFSIGRSLAWLVISLMPWWLTSVLGEFFWTRIGLFALLVTFVALNAFIAYRRRAELIGYLRVHWRTLIFTEVVFLAALWFGLLLRAVNPDLWQIARGGEKPMDFAYLNSVLRTPVFPPPNPWFSGYAINYYYFGFVVAAAPIKIAGIASEIGYNLAMGTLYAVISANVFTLAYALIPSRRRRERLPLAAVGTLFAMVAGNLGTLKQIVAPEPGMTMHRWYWYPTRILGESANRAGGAINEMPLFSFLFGDLHAHIIGLLPAVFYLTMLWVLVKQKNWWIGFFIGAAAGMIYMTNTWDVLLYVPLGIVAIWLATRNVWRFVVYSIPVVIGGVIAFAPYALSFTFGQASGIEAWHGERSLVEPFVLVWGIPIGIAALWMLYRLRRLLPLQINSGDGRGVAVAILLIVMTLVLALQPVTATSILLIALTAPAILLALRDEPQMRFAHVGIAVMFGILLAIEYIVVRGDVGRMNTVFKISFQLWIWAGLIIPMILFFMLRERRYYSAGIMLVLIGFGLLYPFYAIPARYDESVTRQLTLDGGRFMNVIDLSEGEAQPDAELIRYMRANLAGFPVIAEWYQSEYRWNSRISVQTGLPAVVGWANHMRQQYSPISPQVDQRITDLQMLYTSGDPVAMQQVIDDYNIQYIVLGVLERQFMTPNAIIAFDEMEASGDLVPVYEGIETVLYQVADDETAASAP